MTVAAAEMAMRHLPEIEQVMKEHRNQHTPPDVEFFFTETPEDVILWCKNCNAGLLVLPISEPISKQALLSAGWNPLKSGFENEPYGYWISLSDSSLKVREDRDWFLEAWFLEVWFDNDPRYGAGREYMVFVRAGTASIAAREATSMMDLDHLRRVFAVTPRNKEQE